MNVSSRSPLNLSIDVSTKTIYLPKLAFWYRSDFGSSELDCLRSLVSLLSVERREKLREEFSNCFGNADCLEQILQNDGEETNRQLPPGCNIAYNQYSWDSNESVG